MKKTIFCICGRSASGKDTIANMVSEMSGIPKVVSYTTRPRRDGEREDSHIFITEEEWDVLQHEDLCAYTQIGNYCYCTTEPQIRGLLDAHGAVIYVIDPNGIRTLKHWMRDVNIVTIFINVPSPECKKRAERRGDDLYAIQHRFMSEAGQFKIMCREVEYDYAVPNRDVHLACDIIAHIIFRESRD